MIYSHTADSQVHLLQNSYGGSESRKGKVNKLGSNRSNGLKNIIGSNSQINNYVSAQQIQVANKLIAE